MVEMLGFWSYVHKDDELDFGRVGQLARDLVGHYEAIRDETIDLFLDHDKLKWGDDWRGKIDGSLSNVAFFVPVLTPRYFTSVECRREFQFFLDRTKALGVPQLVLPILYIDVPGLHEDNPKDPLMVAAKERQWEPWTDLRFSERESGEYRAAVNKLAADIAERVDAADITDIAAAVAESVASGELPDDALGPLDRIAALEEAMPRWNDTLGTIAVAVQEIGEIMRKGNADVTAGNARGKGFAARLVIVRRVATELEEPVAVIESAAQDWVADLDAVDSGIRALLDRIDEAYADDPAATNTFLKSIRGLSQTANQALGATNGMVENIAPLAEQSRDLRPVLRRLRNSLRSMVEARVITDGWMELVDRTGIVVGDGGGEADAS